MPRVLHCSASCCLVSAGHGMLNRPRDNRHEQHISQSRMFNECVWSCRCHTLCNTCSRGYQLSSSTVVVLSESYMYSSIGITCPQLLSMSGPLSQTHT